MKAFLAAAAVLMMQITIPILVVVSIIYVIIKVKGIDFSRSTQ
jgi:hypothetical protein